MLVEEGDVQRSMTITDANNLKPGCWQHMWSRDVLGNVAPGSAAPIPITTAVPQVAS